MATGSIWARAFPRKHLVGSVLCVLLCMSAVNVAGGAPANDDEHVAAKRSALNGLWRAQISTLLFKLTPTDATTAAETPTPPLEKEFLMRFNSDAKRLARVKGDASPEREEGTFRPEIDCLPPSMPLMMLNDIELIVTRPVVYIMSGGATRHIFTDDQGHPSIHTDEGTSLGENDFIPNDLGHSVGHWNGRVLVVDTIGLKKNPTDGQEVVPQAEFNNGLHVTERLRLVSGDVLEDQITLEDPKILTRPWVASVRYKRSPLREARGDAPRCRAPSQ